MGVALCTRFFRVCTRFVRVFYQIRTRNLNGCLNPCPQVRKELVAGDQTMAVDFGTGTGGNRNCCLTLLGCPPQRQQVMLGVCGQEEGRSRRVMGELVAGDNGSRLRAGQHVRLIPEPSTLCYTLNRR